MSKTLPNPVISLDLIRQQNVGPASEAALQQLDSDWSAVTREFNNQSNKPVVFIVGAGAGAPRSLALRNISSDVFKRVRCFYDVSYLSLSRINNLIEECHQANQPTVTLHITQPLKDSAASFILHAVRANLVPSASEFALSHFNSLNTFIALASHHKKKKSLFAISIISCEGSEIRHHKDLRLLTQLNTSVQVYEEQLLDTWHAHQLCSDQKPQSVINAIEPKNAPKKLTTLNRTASFVSHVLAVTLRSNLNTGRKRKTKRKDAAQHGAMATSPPPTETRSLTHDRVFGSADAINKATTWHEVTAKGKEELLDDERPPTIVVREKLTHPHEMETLIVR